jgi:Ca2+-binding EF-hand superfamily protein
MKKLSLLAAVTALSLPLTAAFAADDAQVARVKAQIEKRFADADADRDGKLSRDEARKMPRVAQAFDQIDTAQTGYVTKEQVLRKMLELAGQ